MATVSHLTVNVNGNSRNKRSKIFILNRYLLNYKALNPRKALKQRQKTLNPQSSTVIENFSTLPL